MSNLSLKIWNFKANFPKRKSAKNNDGQKRPLLEVQIEKSFQFFFFKKMRFYVQKYEKNWKFKNGVKTALTPLFKELWPIFGFLKFNFFSPENELTGQKV